MYTHNTRVLSFDLIRLNFTRTHVLANNSSTARSPPEFQEDVCTHNKSSIVRADSPEFHMHSQPEFYVVLYPPDFTRHVHSQREFSKFLPFSCQPVRAQTASPSVSVGSDSVVGLCCLQSTHTCYMKCLSITFFSCACAPWLSRF